MFDAVRNNKKIVQVFLALITLPFAFFGMEAYMRNAGEDGSVAKVGNSKITQQQFQQALREQQENLRSRMGPAFDAKMLDNPAARKMVLDNMIDQRLLILEASKNNLAVSNDTVRRIIADVPAFQENGKFSQAAYEAALRNQNMSPVGFEAQLRQNLTLRQLAGSVGQSGFISKTVADRLLALQTEKREVKEYRFPIDSYLDKVKLSEGAVQKFYDENKARFELPEQVRAEYVVLSMDSLGAQTAVSEAEIKAWYDGHQDRYTQPEERRAAHILIGTEKIDKDKAKAKAEDVLAQVKKNPAAFGELAKKYSDDPGSAAKGGDLDFFARESMVKPFEDAAFGLKTGEISGLVESEYGFHIIQLTDIRPSKIKPLAQVKGDIEAELKKTAAGRKYAEAAEAFSNIVYEQSDSLKPVADKFHLAIQQSSGWITRQANPANGPLGNQKVLTALFSDEAVNNKRNTESVEIAPNTLVAARIIEHKPAALQPLETVKANVETLLKRQEALAAAKKDGEAALEALKKGEDKLAWGAAKTVSRLDPRLVPPPAMPAIFKMDGEKTPAYTGVELPGVGYALFKLVKTQAGDNLDDATRQTMQRQLTSLAVQEEMQAYLTALKARFKVEIHQSALEAKEK